jgi:hypothetical protein
MGEFPLLPSGKPWQTRVLFRNAPFGSVPTSRRSASCSSPPATRRMCIGKWHLGDQKPFLPTSHGFDQYFGLLYTPDMPPTRLRHRRENRRKEDRPLDDDAALHGRGAQVHPRQQE